MVLKSLAKFKNCLKKISVKNTKKTVLKFLPLKYWC